MKAVSDEAGLDLWQNTLAAIPTHYGRLAYLAGLRNANTGKYEHHGLALLFGAEEANSALRRSHTRCFREWLNLNLDQQAADLDRYVASLGQDSSTVSKAWAEVPAWRHLVPASVRGDERKLFLSEARALLARLQVLAGGSPAPDPDA